jgi:glycine cleavage system transcriptional repressor
MKNWYMLSLVGRDRPSIVAELSAGLCKSGCNLGDSSMARLGGNFTIMLMVQHAGMGVVEDVTGPLAGAGLNILHLDSNVSDDEDSPTYYIHIEGTVAKGIEPIYRVLETLSDEKKIKSQLIPINPEVA